MQKSAGIWIGLSLLIIVLDQLTKWWANTALNFGEQVNVLPFFNLTLVYNTGAAFSFLADAGGWQRWVLSSLSLVVSVMLTLWILRTPREFKWLAIGLALVLGGAVGNLIDRAFFGYVVDFLDVYYQQWHWPAFNVADSAITVGAGILILETLWGKSASQPANNW